MITRSSIPPTAALIPITTLLLLRLLVCEGNSSSCMTEGIAVSTGIISSVRIVVVVVGLSVSTFTAAHEVPDGS